MMPSQRAVIDTHELSPHVNFPSSQKNFVLLLITFRFLIESSVLSNDFNDDLKLKKWFQAALKGVKIKLVSSVKLDCKLDLGIHYFTLHDFQSKKFSAVNQNS